MILRKTRLLPHTDKVLYIHNLIKHKKANRKFLSTHNNFPVPPTHLAFDAYAHTNWKFYFDSGVITAQVIADILNKELPKDNIRILEWGCGPARVIRHLQGLLKNTNVELYGSDYNTESIKWCKDNIKGIKFYINKLQPPFPFKDNFFDCVYAISVFTHLSETMHFEWIKELRRVVKPQGLIIFTTHGDSVSDRLRTDEIQLYNEGKLVVRGKVEEGKKWYLAYHPEEFIKDTLLEGWDVVRHDIVPHAQDIWIARKSDNKNMFRPCR